MASAPPTPPGEAWADYRKLILAEIERLDRRDQLHEDRLARQIESSLTTHAELAKQIEAVEGRHFGFVNEVGHIYVTKADLTAAVDAAARKLFDGLSAKRMAEPVETVRGLWEFRVAVVTGIISILVAILALVRSGA